MNLLRYEPGSGLLSLIDKQISEANTSCAILLSSNEELTLWSEWWTKNGKSNPFISCSAHEIHKDVEKVFVVDSLKNAESAELAMKEALVVHCEWSRGEHSEPRKPYVEKFMLSGYDIRNEKHYIEKIGG